MQKVVSFHIVGFSWISAGLEAQRKDTHRIPDRCMFSMLVLKE